MIKDMIYILNKKRGIIFGKLYSMSHSMGYYFTNDDTDCKGEGCDWDVDVEKIVCEYLGARS